MSKFHQESDPIVVDDVSGVIGENSFSHVFPSLSASCAFAAATERLGRAGGASFSISRAAKVFDRVKNGVVI
jgi:hypothetical protein